MSDCIICGNFSKYYFTKRYKSYLGCPFENDFDVDYFRCDNCGFSFSNTHRNLDKKTWVDLNNSWHHAFESGYFGKEINQPPYAGMAMAVQILSKNNLVNLKNSIDYAAGYGTLAKIFKKYFRETILKYDPYVTDIKYDDGYINALDQHGYNFVINTAMFEHVLTREDLDAVDRLVNDQGVLMLHTQIRNEIPRDPSWFYLEPHVHTAFFTNAAMEILMKQWGYGCSIYSPDARVWFLFKFQHPYYEKIESIVNEINNELQREYFFFKRGFMDYWK